MTSGVPGRRTVACMAVWGGEDASREDRLCLSFVERWGGFQTSVDRYLHAYDVELHRHPRVLEVLSEILCKLQGQSIGPMIRMGSSDSG